ncbi:MAG: tetratricopeptide repeat protein [Elusimicrobia bacterium]|nr:tetratricopeptide repeat protein [Elusimicrobiota bacterium]
MKPLKRAAVLAALALALGLWAPRAALAQDAAAASARNPGLDFYLKALLLENRGDSAGALKAYRAALERDPDSAYLLRQAAREALNSNDAAEAGDWARRAVAADSSDAKSYLLLGQVAWSAGEKDAALSAFERTLELNPASADAAFSEAEILAVDSPARALGFLEAFLTRNPAEASAVRYERAKIEIMAGDLDRARGELESAASMDPELDTLEGRYALAQAYEVRADTASALAQYRVILDQAGPSAPLLDHMGDLLLEENDGRAARARFLAAHELSPSDAEADDYLAADAEGRGDFPAAAAFISSSSALGQDPALSLRLSYDLTQMDQTPAAVRALERAHALWPDNIEVSYFLALGRRDLGQNAAAEALLRSVVKARPDFRDARYQLGSLLESEDRMAESEKEFDALLARDPNDAAALNYLGYSLADRGLQLAKAESLAGRAVKLDPNNGAYVDSLGWAYFKEGRSTEAVSELARAVSLIPDDETIWKHLGEAYAQKGDWPASWKALMRSASLAAPKFSGDSLARPARKRLLAAQLGPLYLKYLAAAQGGVERVSGLCAVRGKVLGRTFSFSGLISFRGPGDLDLEWTGPLFTPIADFRLDEKGLRVSAGALEAAGLDPAAVKAAAGAALELLRGYLSGAVYAQSSARYADPWFSKSRLEGPDWTLALGRGGLFVSEVRSPRWPGVVLRLRRFSFQNGRALPREFVFSGRGFAMDVVLTQVHVRFSPLSAAALVP